MVDSIKDRSSLSTASYAQPSPSSQSLRKSFQHLSSGLDVNETVRDQSAVVNLAKPANKDRMEKLLSGLHDAVSFSSKALEALEQIAREGSGGEPERQTVESIARDLEGIRGDIGNVLEGLRKKADTAEVIQENLTAADVSKEDVKAVQAYAERTGSHIQFSDNEALDAHSGNGGLTIERVASLLAE